jgi:hypothetical protein
MNMRPIVVLACATLALGMVAAPLSAQQASGQTEQPAPAPQAEQLPPPPPFPPMPSSRPSHRFVDVGTHHAGRAHHRAGATHHVSAKRTHHRGRSHASRHAAHKVQPLHLSRKTIRSCHAMSYRQIMRHSSCRALMKQELAAPVHGHRTSHRATHHKASARHHRTRRHS